MAVISRDLPEPKAAKTTRMTAWHLGVFALIVGGILWPLGAKYTLMGWINGLNLLLELLELPARIPPPSGWWWMLCVIPGLLYSLIEVGARPGPPVSWDAIPRWGLAMLILLFVHGSDIGSTLLGYLFPPSDAWRIHTWMATDGIWVLVLWSIILTYLPEQAIIQGHRWIGSPLRHVWTSWKMSGQST